MNKKKWIPFLWLIAAALAIELIICNFSAVKSLFYKERLVFHNIIADGGIETKEDSGEYIVQGGLLTLHISAVDKEIHNLFFDINFPENTVIPYTVMLTDEANSYPFFLPEQVVMSGIKKSFYTNIYASGKTGSIDIQFTLPESSTVIINRVYANARIPFMLSPLRFLFFLGILFLLYYTLSCHKAESFIFGSESILSSSWNNVHRSRKQFLITAITILLLIGMSWKLANINPMFTEPKWPHHKQYQELAEVISQGHFYLDIEPSEELLNAPNPYDTIYLQANGIDYLADYAYYDGKYYVYFGIVPELLLYLPCYLITGHHMPNYLSVFFFYCGFILAVFALYREICKKWFPHTPFIIYLLSGIITVCSGNYLFIIARPDLYNVPIIAANMFTAAGLWLWIKGKYAVSSRGKKICFLGGSLCMALVAGCRPQMLLFSILAVPLFWEEVIRKRELFSRKKLWDTICICLPYLIVAVGIMYYNAARFSSPFDFGATYSLTSNDMTKREFNLHQALLGLWHYFFRPPVVESEFPFIQGVPIVSNAYMGRLNAEFTYGGLITSNAFLWILILIGSKKELLKSKKIYIFSLLSIGISFALGILDVTYAGILQRYLTDTIWGVWLAAALLWFAWAEKAKSGKTLSTVILCITAVCLIQTVYGLGVVLGSGDLGANIQIANPNLYYYLKKLFTFT
ncbi:MAG: hypothetical protein NC433_10470 [Clostridiales bacterium]|nr:hypothetical protein [Clostridiales bacterium]